MGFFTHIKEKVRNGKSNGAKAYDEELNQLDALIEDLFKMDEKPANAEKKEKED